MLLACFVSKARISAHVVFLQAVQVLKSSRQLDIIVKKYAVSVTAPVRQENFWFYAHIR